MIESGSQSTACCLDSAKDYADRDSQRAELWDQKIGAHGKNIVDVMFHGETNEASHPSQHQSGCV